MQRLALDLRWSWNHATDELWRWIDPDLWARTHNPWVVLRSVSTRRLNELLATPEFRAALGRLSERVDAGTTSPTWFEMSHLNDRLTRVAYFSMEFMLSEALPIYAGGLGNVAGDQLKAASDLGIPVVGVGLLYQQGYFRQVIDRQGAQRALFPYNEPAQLPITAVRGSDGERLRLEIRLPGYSLWVRAWHVQVGRQDLYLLDSNDSANDPAHRCITSELYCSDPELRLQQEILLGIGGWRLLEALNLPPEVCHLNEGHAAFAILDRARSFMERTGTAFDAALCSTRAGNVFTTHTAVSAGFDRFTPQLMERYLGSYTAHSLRIELRELLALGREDPDDDSECFNMAHLALRGSSAINGVSRLHGGVSRRIFQPLFPRWPSDEVPIGSITNGVHTPSWDSPEADALWTSHCGKDRWLGSLEAVGGRIASAPDGDIWQCRNAARASLVAYSRERLSAQLAASGATEEQIENSRHLFRTDALTLGFARRFAAYKRPNLLLYDQDRLARLLTRTETPVQLVIAGKAHPADTAAQSWIRDWVNFVRRDDVRAHAIFLADYDMLLTERLVAGVDVWINTPARPWEACGTSGMKVLVNGGLNLSELDGWWAEAYNPTVGWALGDDRDHAKDPLWNDLEAVQLYQLLEEQVIPEFYARDATDIPRAWVARVRASMASLTSVYSANRSVREYLHTAYLPAASSYRRRALNSGALGTEISAWRQALDHGWGALRFGTATAVTRDEWHHFTVQVNLGALASAVRVELYAEPSGTEPACRQPMSRMGGDGSGLDLYFASAPASRPANDYTARIIGAHPDADAPLESPRILWQR